MTISRQKFYNFFFEIAKILKCQASITIYYSIIIKINTVKRKRDNRLFRKFSPINFKRLRLKNNEIYNSKKIYRNLLNEYMLVK